MVDAELDAEGVSSELKGDMVVVERGGNEEGTSVVEDVVVEDKELVDTQGTLSLASLDAADAIPWPSTALTMKARCPHSGAGKLVLTRTPASSGVASTSTPPWSLPSREYVTR